MTEEHMALMKVMRFHTGKAKAIISKDLRWEIVQTSQRHMSARQIRELKFELNTYFGAYICSCGDGYYLAATDEEVNEVRAYYLSWIKNMSREAKRIKLNFIENSKRTQLRLF